MQFSSLSDEKKSLNFFSRTIRTWKINGRDIVKVTFAKNVEYKLRSTIGRVHMVTTAADILHPVQF